MKTFLILLLSLCALTASAQTDNVRHGKPTTSAAKPKPKTTPAKPKPATPAAKPTAKPVAKPAAPQDPPVAAETTGLTFAITGDATCKVVKDYSYKGNIVIPPFVIINGKTYTVNEIDEYAFYECAQLTSIAIPGSVEYIGTSAFYGCTNLATLSLANGIKEIKKSAFGNCEALTSVTIPNSVTTIGEDAFFSCEALTTLTLSRSLTEIGNDAFSYSRAIKTINSYAKTPPRLPGGWTFPVKIVVHVPKGCAEVYKQDPNWNNERVFIEDLK